jgi:hypothetical protein
MRNDAGAGDDVASHRKTFLLAVDRERRRKWGRRSITRIDVNGEGRRAKGARAIKAAREMREMGEGKE